MSLPSQPRLRPGFDTFPISQPDGEVVFALRDPEGFWAPIVLPYAAAAAVSLMDGSRTLEEIRSLFQQCFKQEVELAVLEQLLADLDRRLFLDTPRFRAQWKLAVEQYLNGSPGPRPMPAVPTRSRACACAGEAVGVVVHGG